MPGRYRLHEFVPDPFLGSGVPYGALVETGGTVRAALAERVPGPDCLGSLPAARALAHCRELAGSLRSFDALPLGAGPQVRLGPVVHVPAGVEDAAHWIVTHLLPQKMR